MKKLKGKLLGQGKTYKECAYVLGCPVTTISNKLQGKVPCDCWKAEKNF